MSTARAHRTRPRHDARSIVGSARDVAVLESLAWAGFLTTAQVTRLHFPSRRTAQRRLRALLDHGLVRARLQGDALQRDNVFSPTPRGLDLLAEAGGVEPASVRRTRVPRYHKLGHALAIRDVFVAFRTAEYAGHFTLADFRFDDDLVGELALQAAGLVPDAAAVLSDGEAERRLFVEVDLGTETTTKVRDKLNRYRTLRDLQLLVVVPGDGRAKTWRCLGHETALGGMCVALHADLAKTVRDYSHALFAHPVRPERTPVVDESAGFWPVSEGAAAAFRVSTPGHE